MVFDAEAGGPDERVVVRGGGELEMSTTRGS